MIKIYNLASTLNGVMGIDNAITTDIKVNEKGVKVTNNTDKYINNICILYRRLMLHTLEVCYLYS